MIVVRDPNLTNAPPGWSAVDRMLGEFRAPTTFGFVGAARDINRYWSRYRLARSYREVAIDVFTADTVRGYSALVRVFFVWSAFEQLMRICGLTFRTAAAAIAPYDVPAFEAGIRGVPNFAQFLRAVRNELDRQPLIQNMDAFLSGRPCNALVVPASIRHIFVHGKLTPNSGVGNVEAACAIAGMVCEFLFRVMDGEFSARLRAHGIAV